MVERQKAEIISTKCWRDRGKISSSSQKNKNDCDKFDTDPNQEDNLNPTF